MPMLWFKFIFGLIFSNQLDFYFSLSRIYLDNLQHREIKTNWFEKLNLNQRLIFKQQHR